MPSGVCVVDARQDLACGLMRMRDGSMGEFSFECAEHELVMRRQPITWKGRESEGREVVEQPRRGGGVGRVAGDQGGDEQFCGSCW